MTDKKKYTSNSHTFLRPECFCAEMISNGFAFDLIKIKNNSAFKKSFRNEIEAINLKYNDADNLELELFINRDGLYDRLPEGLFHQTKGNSKTSNVQEMTEEFRRFREEEKEARKFFQPLEQEIFRYLTHVEQEELNLSFGMLNGDLKNELLLFWNLPNGLPEQCIKRLLQIIPWINHIKGNLQITAIALELLLGNPVDYEEKFLSSQIVQVQENKLGGSELGIETVLGNNFQEPSVNWKFSIKGVKKNAIELYRPDNPYGMFLKHFEEIFIPLEIDIIFDFTEINARDYETEDVVGFSFVL